MRCWSGVNEVAAAVERVRERIAAAAERAGRQAAAARLVAVSKGAPLELMRQALDAGQLDFGENRVPEALAKQGQLGPEVRWHFVGRLQRNKVRPLLDFVGLIHSVDRVELAQEIDRRASGPVEVLVEVNTSGEPHKAGMNPEDLHDLLEDLSGMAGLRVTGLMTMAPRVSSPEEARPFFRRLARMRDDMQKLFPQMPVHHLSMGMSQDYEIAVEEGATLVRVGEAIFGPRVA